MKNAYIFIGRSGCGKGTQAELLKTYLEKKDPQQKVIWFGTGERFRNFLKEPGYTQDIARDYVEKGKLSPEFLAIHIWSHFFIEEIKGDENIIFDGTPRKLNEARVLDDALGFYNTKVCVIFMNVSRDWARERLLGRGRQDDTEEYIKSRLDWFETDVAETIAFYKNLNHTFLEINGEQPIPKVHQDIIEKVSLSTGGLPKGDNS
ncbi:MAG: nucleoside monophosphate kinase [Parcubacteria group bacterium]|nr:nucleoside monophosphate kinase [Parcubacteria group bacterium]